MTRGVRGDRRDRVLLLGGCGYVGSALYDHLFHRRWHVDTVDLELFGNGVNRRNVRRDYAYLMRDELAGYGAVVLLADPPCVERFVALLDELDEGQRLVYMSSSTVYGPTRGREATEQEPVGKPVSARDRAWIGLEAQAARSGLDCYGLRLGEVTGYARHLRRDLLLNGLVAEHREAGAIRVERPEAYRPVLGVRDLARAVERVLLEPRRLPGVYNLASFNATQGELAERASALLRADLLPATGGRPAAGWSVSSARFCEAFDFELEDTVESIVRSLDDGWARACVTTREEPLCHA